MGGVRVGALQGPLPKTHGSYKLVQNPCLGLNNPLTVPASSVSEGDAELRARPK